MKVIIGVMGPGKASPIEWQTAYQLGKGIAEEGWILLTGGRNVGVMEAASLGAKSANGLTVGILPTSDKTVVSEGVDIAIFTNLGNGRNHLNILSSEVVIACGMGAGTASEIALALKEKKKVILLNNPLESQQFFKWLSPEILTAETVEEAIALTKSLLIPQN